MSEDSRVVLSILREDNANPKNIVQEYRELGLRGDIGVHGVN